MKVQFASRGWEEDYLTWQRDRQMLKRVNALIEDIRRNGHQGIGKPEQLRGKWSGFWSRRIDQEHRLVSLAKHHGRNPLLCKVRFARGSNPNGVPVTPGGSPGRA